MWLYLADNTLEACVTAVKSGFEDNSLVTGKPIIRFSTKPSCAVAVSYCPKQWEQKSEWVPPQPYNRFQNFFLVSAKDAEEELFLAYLINSPLIKAFLLLEG